MRLGDLARRVLAIAIPVVLGLFVYWLAALPLWQHWQQTRDAVAEYESRIARLLGIVAQSKRLSERRDASPAESDPRRFLIAGTTATLAAAALQKRVGSTVRQSGGRLASTRVLRAEEEHGFVRIAIAVRLEVDTPGLQQALYALESRLPLLVVDELVVIARGGRGSGGTGRGPANLDVQLRISGWMAGSSEAA